MSIAASIEGADQVARSMRAAADELGDLSDAHDDAGQQVAAVARRLAPVRTGRLRGSISVEASAGAVTVTAGAPYAAYVHARNPFLSDALERQEAAAVATITNAVEDVLDTIEGA